ncbi:MAG: hypothetical protein WCB15_08120 [Desulfobacterales bacterium]
MVEFAVQVIGKVPEADLKSLDRDIEAIVSKNPATPLIVSHPVYDYFTRRYGDY